MSRDGQSGENNEPKAYKAYSKFNSKNQVELEGVYRRGYKLLSALLKNGVKETKKYDDDLAVDRQEKVLQFQFEALVDAVKNIQHYLYEVESIPVMPQSQRIMIGKFLNGEKIDTQVLIKKAFDNKNKPLKMLSFLCESLRIDGEEFSYEKEFFGLDGKFNSQRKLKLESLLTITKQLAVQHSLRLFLLVGDGEKHYSFFKTKDKGEVSKRSHLADFATYKKWFGGKYPQYFSANQNADDKDAQNSNKKEQDSTLFDSAELEVFFNNFLRDVSEKSEKNIGRVRTLPVVMEKTMLGFLDPKSRFNYISSNSHQYFYLGNQREIIGLSESPRLLKNVTRFANNFNKRFKRLESLDLRRPYAYSSDAGFQLMLRKVKKIARLQKLHLSVGTKQQLLSLLDDELMKKITSLNVYTEIKGFYDADADADADIIAAIEQFENLKSLKLNIPSVDDWSFLCEQFGLLKTSSSRGGLEKDCFFKKLNMTIGKVKKGWVDCNQIVQILKNNPKLSLSGDLVDFLDIKGNFTSLTVPERFHWVANKVDMAGNERFPKLEILKFSDSVRLSALLNIAKHPSLKTLEFGSVVQWEKMIITDNPLLKVIAIADYGRQVGGLHCKDALFLWGNDKLESMTVGKYFSAVGKFTIRNNNSLKKLEFGKNGCFENDVLVKDNDKLTKLVFGDETQIKGTLELHGNVENKGSQTIMFGRRTTIQKLDLSRFDQSTNFVIGQGVEINEIKFSEVGAGVYRSIFSNVRSLQKLELPKGEKLVGSGLFIALLFNKNLERKDITRGYGYEGVEKPHIDHKWFRLRDMLLRAREGLVNNEEEALSKFDSENIELLKTVEGDLKDYLNSHYPRDKDSNNFNKLSCYDKKNEVASEDYSLIENVAKAIEKLIGQSAKVTEKKYEVFAKKECASYERPTISYLNRMNENEAQGCVERYYSKVQQDKIMSKTRHRSSDVGLCGNVPPDSKLKDAVSELSSGCAINNKQ